MKSLVLSRGENIHDKAEGVWLQTRPSGDLEIIADGALYWPNGIRQNGIKKSHDCKIIGVIPRSELANLIEWLQQVE